MRARVTYASLWRSSCCVRVRALARVNSLAFGLVITARITMYTFCDSSQERIGCDRAGIAGYLFWISVERAILDEPGWPTHAKATLRMAFFTARPTPCTTIVFPPKIRALLTSYSLFLLLSHGRRLCLRSIRRAIVTRNLDGDSLSLISVVVLAKWIIRLNSYWWLLLSNNHSLLAHLR